MADKNLKLDVKLTGLERPRVALTVLAQLEALEFEAAGREGLDGRRLAVWLRLMRAEIRGAQRALDAGRELVGLKAGPGEVARAKDRPLAGQAVRVMRLSAVRMVLGHLRQLAALAVGAMESQDRQGVPTPTRAEEDAHARGRVEARAAWDGRALDAPKGSAAVRARPARRRRSS